jgi:hypothetical protein
MSNTAGAIAQPNRPSLPARAGSGAGVPFRVAAAMTVVATGVASGALGALWFERSGPVIAAAAAMPRTQAPDELAEHARTRARVRALEDRLARTQGVDALARAPAEDPETRPAIVDGEPAPSHEEWAEHHRRLHADAIELHRGDARDPEWAHATERTLGGDLNKVGAQPVGTFELMSIDCKTTSCLANLRWRSYGEAVNGFAGALHFNYSLPCGTRILLPEPVNPEQSYEATLIFDCEDARINE